MTGKGKFRKITRGRLREGRAVRRAFGLHIIGQLIMAYKQFISSHNKSGGDWHLFRDKII